MGHVCVVHIVYEVSVRFAARSRDAIAYEIVIHPWVAVYWYYSTHTHTCVRVFLHSVNPLHSTLTGRATKTQIQHTQTHTPKLCPGPQTGTLKRLTVPLPLPPDGRLLSPFLARCRLSRFWWCAVRRRTNVMTSRASAAITHTQPHTRSHRNGGHPV